MTTDILHDKRTIKRTIKRITSEMNPDEFDWMVGARGITRIVPYEEHGWGSMVTWFAVYDDEDIRWRVPAAGMVVEYAPLLEMPF